MMGRPAPSAPALHFNQMPSTPLLSQPPAKNPIKSMFCDDCPLYWFHRLCCDIESLPAEASKAIILRRIDSSFSDREQDEVYSKFSEFNIESIDEHNEIFMSILRQLSERKQHKHNQSQAHASAMARNLRLAKQQTSEMLKQQTAVQLTQPQGGAGPGAAHTGLRPAAGHQRSGSSSGSLASVIGQANANANQSLADASCAAIDNLKRAKNSISVSIENLLKRRASLRDGDEHQDDLLRVSSSGNGGGAAGSLIRSGSFKCGSRELRSANSDLERNSSEPCETGAALLNLKRSQSTSDHRRANPGEGPSAMAEENLEALRRQDSFATSEQSEDSRLDSKRTSNDSLSMACHQSEHSSRPHSPPRLRPQHYKPPPPPPPPSLTQDPPSAAWSARWIQPNRRLGQSSPSSYLSGAFWKKSIFDKIHQPTQAPETPAGQPSCEARPAPAPATAVQLSASAQTAPRRTRDELRSLWRKAILEQITLLKMDKQNQKLQANSVECNIQRIKLNYRDVPFAREAAHLWAKLLKQDPSRKVQFVEVARLVRLGVPKQRRGEIWMFLMNQYQLRHGTSFQPPPDSEFKGDADQTFRSLLSQLSTQQHEIFVDIGK